MFALFRRYHVLSTLLGLLMVISASGAQARPLSPQPAAGLRPLSPGSPFYGPTIDPRGLRDRQQRQASAALQRSLSQSPATLGDRLGQGVTRKATRPPGTALQQTTTCDERIVNSGLTDTNQDGVLSPDDDGNWYTDVPSATIETAIFRSAPNAVRLEDGDETTNADDRDMISHDIEFDPDDTDLSIEFQAYQANLDPGFDFLYYGLATFVENTSTVDEYLYWNVVPDQEPETWQTVYDRIDDPTLIQQLKDADKVGIGVWLIFYNSTDGAEPFNISIIDDVSLISCISNASLSGTVTKGGKPADNIEVLLEYHDSSGSSEVVDSVTSSGGTYSFNDVRPLASDGSESYQVSFSNDGSDSSKVSLWSGPRITTLSNTTQLPPFDIADVPLSAPADQVERTLPTTFSWASRGLSGEKFYFCIYNPDTFEGGCSERLSTTSYQLTLAKLNELTEMNFSYGQNLAWYVIVEAQGGDIDAGTNYGFSFYERGITFIETVPPPPPPPPPPSGNPPIGGAGQDWTVMVYIAGDNNLGDLRRYANPTANLQGQFNTLKNLAASYPKVNIVTLTDFYDGTGTMFCHLKANGTQNCQQLGEKDTSSPAVLTTFINDAIDRFPAKRTMLVIADHGHSIGGVAADETTGATATMDPAEIRQAMQNSRLANKKADIIFYNACLMGSVESAFNAAPFANYLVASADELWVLSVYERVLPLLSGLNKDNPRAVAAGMVDAYRRSVQAAASLYISSAAYDLSKTTLLNNAVSNLGIAITDGLNSGQAELVRSSLNRIRNATQVYDSSGNNLLDPTEDAFVDLRHFATQLKEIPSANNGGKPIAELQALRDAATQLLGVLGPVGGTNAVVIASVQLSGSNGEGGSHNLSSASGISLFMPNANTEAFSKGQQRALTNLYLNNKLFEQFATAGQWDEALRLYTGVGGGSAPTGGPGRFVRGTLPIDGALPDTGGRAFLPMVRR